MRADNSPLAGPILSDGLKPMNVATIHAVGPSYVVGQHSKNAVRVELEPAGVTILVMRGYLDPKDKENFAEIEAAANAFISDALATP